MGRLRLDDHDGAVWVGGWRVPEHHEKHHVGRLDGCQRPNPEGRVLAIELQRPRLVVRAASMAQLMLCSAREACGGRYPRPQSSLHHLRARSALHRLRGSQPRRASLRRACRWYRQAVYRP